MKILSYSPKVEVYISTGTDVYDLSDDVVSCSVNRISGGASTFNVTLQNHNFKYNNVFSPMDRIVIYATKKKRVKLLTGYVSSTDRFSLYQQDFKISGYCVLYRLQRLYWDPMLEASQKAMWTYAYTNGEFDNGYSKVATNLLVNVAGWDAGMIFIQSDIPVAATEFARSMYENKLKASKQAVSMADEFYKILREHGPALSADTTTTTTSSGGGHEYTGIDFEMDEKSFVKKWGERINTYINSHYPSGALNGHGETIAREARRNGCDPRIIVAIAVGETSCGAVSAKSGIHGTHNYWSWGCYPGSETIAPNVGIWADSVDGAIKEFCEKFSDRYAGCSPTECANLGYGEADYIASVWQPVIDAI